jgi:pseudomonalisin
LTNRRRRLATLAATSLALGSLGSTAAFAATGPALSHPALDAATLVATATRAWPVADIPGLQVLGSVPSGQVLNLVISLKPRDPAGEVAALKAMYDPASPTYEHFLTPAEFAAAYGAAPAEIDAVTGYLRSAGMTDVSVLPDDLVVTATATAAQAEQAFHTSLASVVMGAQRFFVNTTAALVPSSLSGAVLAVLGLNDIPLPTPHPLAAQPQAGSFAGPEELPPADFQNTYDAKGTPSATATSIALLTEGDISAVYSDLRLAEKINHLPQVAVTQINVGPQSSDTSGQDEFDLDTQSSTAMATTVRHLYLYNIGSLADAPVDLDFATFVSQDKAQAMSASIGGCDLFPYLDGSMVSTDQVTMEGAMQGQSLFASSGDNGDGCAFLAATGVPSSFPGTNWPASGEFTTAVGGTSLLADSSGNRIEELGWVGSGGGLSEVENPGWWTQDSDPGYNNQYVSGGRAVPDVALDADPNVATAALIYVNGQPTGVGGTSLSSPLMLGAWARLETAHHNQLGFAPIRLYALYDKVNPGTPVPGSPIPTVIPSPDPAPVPGFTDITIGDNGLYPCLPGYDEVTGLGAPDIAALSAALG